MRRAIRIGVLVAVFGAGYLLGTVTQPTAEAHMGELGKKAMEQAAGAGGPLGTAAQLPQPRADARASATRRAQSASSSRSAGGRRGARGWMASQARPPVSWR